MVALDRVRDESLLDVAWVYRISRETTIELGIRSTSR